MLIFKQGGPTAQTPQSRLYYLTIVFSMWSYARQSLKVLRTNHQHTLCRSCVRASVCHRLRSVDPRERFVEGKTTMHFRRRCLVKLLAPAFLFSLIACTNGNQPSAASPPHSLVRPQSSAPAIVPSSQQQRKSPFRPTNWRAMAICGLPAGRTMTTYTQRMEMERHSRMPPVVTTWP